MACTSTIAGASTYQEHRILLSELKPSQAARARGTTIKDALQPDAVDNEDDDVVQRSR
jgi:hypothetical protein